MFVNSLVAAVASAASFGLQRQATRFEKCEVMDFPFSKSRGQQTARAALNYELGLTGVALLLAAIVPFLFF